MSINTAPGQDLTCGHCGRPAPVGDRYCERCGAPLGTEVSGQRRPAERESNASAQRRWAQDGPTRYLCAAAHLDPLFATAAIGEYLVEETRAVPPSPGVDSVAVLRDAVAARYRRRVRDAVLLMLALFFLLASPPLALSWLVVGVLVAVTSAVTRAGAGIQAPTSVAGAVNGYVAARRTGVMLTLGLALAGIVAVFVVPGISYLVFSAFGADSSSAGTLLALLFGALILGVLVADELLVAALTRGRFVPEEFTPDPGERPGWEMVLRTLGHSRFARQLTRVAEADRRGTVADEAEVTVFRGWRPFLGAGEPIRNRVYALPLKPAEDGEATDEPRKFTVLELQRHLGGELARLRDSRSLAPGRRLAKLSIREQVFIPAEALVRRLDDPALLGVLTDLRHPPLGHLPSQVAQQLADAPQELARYYQRYGVEAWDRDLNVTCYLAAGTDNHTLYVEWTHCVLFPIAQRYRSIDEADEVGPLPRALLQAVAFPATLLTRLGTVAHRFRPIRERRGVVSPARYGAGHSVREIAADSSPRSYFQDADALRYMEVLEQGLFRAVGEFLQERGYEIRDVLDIAKETVKQSVVTNNIHNSVLNHTAVGGRDASSGAGSTGPSAGRGSGGTSGGTR